MDIFSSEDPTRKRLAFVEANALERLAPIPPDAPVIRSYEEKQRAPDDWEAQTSQRPIARHSLEHLATSDRGVALFRRHLRDAIKVMESGEDPPGTARKPQEELITVPSGNEVIAPD